MYHPVSIQHLSSNQISKLLNGHGIRIKVGQGHQIEVSAGQHKKLQKAFGKGAASTIQFDPFQQANHQHLRGHGLKSAFKKAGHFVKQHKEHFRPLANSLKESGHQALSHQLQSNQAEVEPEASKKQDENES